MSYELVIKRTKSIESSLTSLFNANGRGLHEKLSSVEGEISKLIIRKIRYIASVRNKFIHDDAVDLTVNDISDFQNACDEVDSYFSKISESRKIADKQNITAVSGREDKVSVKEDTPTWKKIAYAAAAIVTLVLMSQK